MLGRWWIMFGLVMGTGQAEAQVPSCHDVNIEAQARHLDAFNFATYAYPIQQAFRAADAERAGSGQTTFLQDWNEDRMIGEVAVVFYSCQRHPADTLDQRARAVFNEYVVLHSQ